MTVTCLIKFYVNTSQLLIEKVNSHGNEIIIERKVIQTKSLRKGKYTYDTQFFKIK